MKSLLFVTIATAALTLAACNRGNEDAVNNAELNQPDAELNDVANQQNMLAAENAAAQDHVTNPKEADEQNVSGM